MPLIIYYSGPDGSGKTTAVDETKLFFDSNGMKYKYFYTMNKILRHIIIRAYWLRKVVLKPSVQHIPFKKYLGMRDGHLDRDNGSYSWKIRKLLSLYVSFVDVWLGWFLTSFLRLRGYIIIVETSPYDIFTKYHMPEFPLLEKIMVPLMPKPSLGLLLTASASSIVERKAELTIEEIEGYYSRINKIISMSKAKNYRELQAGEGLDKMFVSLKKILNENINAQDKK